METSALCNVATLGLENSFELLSGTLRRWKYDSRESHDIGPTIAMLPCFYEHERSYSHFMQSLNPNFLSLVFAGATAIPHPTSSQPILASLKVLSTVLDPKTLKPTIILISFYGLVFGLSSSAYFICRGVFGLLVLEKEPCERVVVTGTLGLSQEHYLT